MYFTDLELCVYHRGSLDAASWAVPLRAVGWLEYPHSFTRGTVPANFVARLADLVDQARSNFPHEVFRGGYTCTLCAVEARTGPSEIGWSQENLIIPGDGEVFAAPGGIVHYVSDHAYCPPISFVQAVFNCPPIGSPEYLEKMHTANAGKAIPLETAAEYDRRSRAMFDDSARFRAILGIGVVGASREQILAAASQVWPGSDLLDAEGSVFLGEPKNLKVTFDRAGIAIAIEPIF